MNDAPDAPHAFAQLADAHLDAAYNLARWLTRDAALAEDVVQDAMLRALTYFAGFRGDNPRAWLLQIVRNVAVTRLAAQRAAPLPIDAVLPREAHGALADPGAGPEAAAHAAERSRIVARCVDALPLELRECLVLREWEELSYKEIARVVRAPIGTVMSRLWRARQRLAEGLASCGETGS